MPFADFTEVISVDGKGDGIRNQPGVPELGPQQEPPILNPFMETKG